MESKPNDIFGWAPISQMVGLEVQPGEQGEATVFLNVDSRMHNPMGYVHGGIIALLCDAAMGIAFGRTLEDQQSFATVEMKTSYLRPLKQARLCATAQLLQRGLRIGFVECEIRDTRQRMIAKGSCTCTVNSLGS
ncbi:MAG: PaaI family thioesterase [Planctomycetota bacterium]